MQVEHAGQTYPMRVSWDGPDVTVGPVPPPAPVEPPPAWPLSGRTVPAWATRPGRVDPGPGGPVGRADPTRPDAVGRAGSAALTGGAGRRRLGRAAQPDLTSTASLRPAALDARRGIVRLHPEALTALAAPAPRSALSAAGNTGRDRGGGRAGASSALLYADDLTLGNLGLRDGGQVRAPGAGRPRRRVVLAGPVGVVAAVSRRCSGSPCWARCSPPGTTCRCCRGRAAGRLGPSLVEAARRSLANTVGFAWTSTLLSVVTVEPAAGALVTMDTSVAWEHGATTHGGPAPVGAAWTRPVRAPTPFAGRPDVDELPGLRAQAEELTELLTSASTTGEVLGPLGTTISLGVLLAAPEVGVVRAVAARVGARVHPLWAPEVAALASQAAAERSALAASAARRGRRTCRSDLSRGARPGRRSGSGGDGVPSGARGDPRRRRRGLHHRPPGGGRPRTARARPAVAADQAPSAPGSGAAPPAHR